LIVWLWALALCALLTFPSIVLPHAALVKSIPARRAQIFKAPTQIQLWFNESLEARFSSLWVIDSSGKRVDLGNVEVSTDDRKRISVGVNPLAPGQYRIRFRVLSVDGHIVEDEFPFTIRDAQRAP
jgi:methionine-rich copper-binding protein CopC